MLSDDTLLFSWTDVSKNGRFRSYRCRPLDR